MMLDLAINLIEKVLAIKYTVSLHESKYFMYNDLKEMFYPEFFFPQ